MSLYINANQESKEMVGILTIESKRVAALNQNRKLLKGFSSILSKFVFKYINENNEITIKDGI